MFEEIINASSELSRLIRLSKATQSNVYDKETFRRLMRLIFCEINSDKDRELLHKILGESPEILEYITADKIFTIIPEDMLTINIKGIITRISILPWIKKSLNFSNHEDHSPKTINAPRVGQEILQKLLNEKSKIFKNVTKKHLFTSFTPSTTLLSLTAFDILIGTNSLGQQILQRVIEENPKVLKDMKTTRYFFEKSASHINREAAPFFWLAMNTDNHKTLLEIFKQNPDILKNVSTEILAKSLFTTVSEISNATPFSTLVFNPKEGKQILKQIVEAKPDVLKYVTEDTLFKILPEVGSDTFSKLAKSTDNHKTLLEIFNQNPDILKNISTEKLAKCLFAVPSTQYNYSPFSVLAANHEEGKLILEQIVKIHPGILKYVTKKILFEILPNDADTFFRLTVTIPTMLEKIFEKKPELLEDITPEILCRIYPKHKLSTFHLLSVRHNILQIIADKNPNALKGLPSSILFKNILLPFKNTRKKSSPFYQLSAFKQGHQTLKILLALNPKLYDDIITMGVFIKHTEDSKQPENSEQDTPTFDLLSETSAGRDILKVMFNTIRAKKRERTVTDILATKNPTILKKILENNPELLSSINPGILKRAAAYILATENPAILEKILTNYSELSEDTNSGTTSITKPKDEGHKENKKTEETEEVEIGSEKDKVGEKNEKDEEVEKIEKRNSNKKKLKM